MANELGYGFGSFTDDENFSRLRVDPSHSAAIMEGYINSDKNITDQDELGSQTERTRIVNDNELARDALATARMKREDWVYNSPNV